MLARFYSLLFIVCLSCTIINDSDITSQEELDRLKLTSFDIVQQTVSGTKTTTAILKRDSAMSFLDTSTGATLIRVVDFGIPALPNSKLKFRSGTTASLRTSLTTISGNKPYTFVLYEKDSAVEIYRFRYDATGRINKIITIVNPVDQKKELFRTNDSLIYEGSDVKSIIRKSPEVSRQGTFTINYGGSGSFQSISEVRFFSYRLAQNDNMCPNRNSSSGCLGYEYRPSVQTSGPEIISSLVFSSVNVFESTSQVKFEDYKFNSCCHDYDTYYFHPLMITHSQFTKGKFLLLMYMLDWWVPGATNNNQQSSEVKTEAVTINFNYGL